MDTRGQASGWPERPQTPRHGQELAAASAVQALELIESVVVQTDPRGKVQSLNPAACRLLGLSKDQVRGHPWCDRFVLPPDTPSLQQIFRRLLAGEQQGVVTGKSRVITARGDVRDVIWRHAAVRDQDGCPAGVLSCGEDVTVRRRAHAHSRQTEQRLRQREGQIRDHHQLQAIGRLSTGIAHDFNNQLTLIRSYLRTLRDRPGTPLAAEALARLERVAGAAQATVSRLLAFSRGQSGPTEAVDLRPLLLELRDSLLRLLGPDIRLQVAVPPGLPAVAAEYQGLEHAIMNLAINAADAMPDGGTLVIRARRGTLGEWPGQAGPADSSLPPDASPPPDPSPPAVLVEVIDNGSGMDEEILARACEPFYTTKAAGHGTGLGLPLAVRLIEDCGGWLRLHSEPGRGTTVTFALPAI